VLLEELTVELYFLVVGELTIKIINNITTTPIMAEMVIRFLLLLADFISNT